MAASFVNLETGKAFRVISTEESRALAPVFAPEIPEKYPQQLEAYKRMPDSVLFRVEEVVIDVCDADLPGPTRYKTTCAACGQVVRDRREVMVEGRPPGRLALAAPISATYARFPLGRRLLFVMPFAQRAGRRGIPLQPGRGLPLILYDPGVTTNYETGGRFTAHPFTNSPVEHNGGCAVLKSIPLEQAVGLTLAHDITEIRPGVFKGPAFRKGHTAVRKTSAICSAWGKIISMSLTWPRTRSMKMKPPPSWRRPWPGMASPGKTNPRKVRSICWPAETACCA
jgi:hypothetical protein